MGRITTMCCAAALVTPVFAALVQADEPVCVEESAATTTSTTVIEPAPVSSTTTTTTTVPPTTVAPEPAPTTTLAPEVSTTTTTTTPEPAPSTTVAEEDMLLQSMSDGLDPLQPLLEEAPTETTVAPDETTTTTTTVPPTPPTTALESVMTIPPEEVTPTTTTTLPEQLDPECAPIVEILDFPGWGTSEDYFPQVASSEFDMAKASESTTTTTTTVPPAGANAPSLQPPTISPAGPADPRVDTVYEVSAQISVTEPVVLSALQGVSMCWWKADDVGVDKASTDCSTLDPRYNFKMMWTESAATNDGSGGFAVATSADFPTNQYQNVGSQVEVMEGVASYDPNAHSMTINFKFRVSSAMAQGDQWSVSVTATYDEIGAPVTTTTTSDLSVGHWSEIFTQKQSVDFGPVGPLGEKASPELNLGKYRANGTSRLTLQGSDYSCVGDGCTTSLTLATTTPSGGSVWLKCTPKDGAEINVTTGASQFLLLDPTGEEDATLPTFTCSLTYGGGASRALATYSGPISMNIGPIPDPSPPGGGG